MTLFLDACIVIYWVEARDPFHARLMAFLHGLRREHPEACFAASRLSWLECMVKPLRDQDDALVNDYRSFFDSAQLEVVELTRQVIERAADLRAEHRLKTPDALQVACAFDLAGEVLFLTNDQHFGSLPGLHVEIPV